MQCKTARTRGTGIQSVSCILLTEVPSKPWHYIVPKDIYFSFTFAWDSSELGFFH